MLSFLKKDGKVVFECEEYQLPYATGIDII